MPTTPHRWITLADGDLDNFAYETGYHNGPKCEACGYFYCEHCNPEGDQTECGTAAVAGDDANLDPSMVALDAALRARFR